MRGSVFPERFNAIAQTLGKQALTPNRAVEAWLQFVENCEEGYEDSLAEYRNELSIRRFLQAVISDPQVQQASDAQWFITEVAAIDARFSSLLEDGFQVTGSWGWWERRIPRVGGGVFVIDVRDAYGVDIELS
ncbi:hypothetical protein ACFU8W_24790 [Streptomyces sp. NPDC057565]|uniref:hypothetical protein n=1 Tax=Streptomyces sp. NPDC057565 TaxID=3346169 RepID=UPI0036AFF9FC